MSDKELELELRGRAWYVYWYMLKKGVDQPVTAREVQRQLGFKSPSIASHHLERLRKISLVTKNNEGDYVLVGEVKLGVLRHFVRLGRVIIPRFVLYASFVTVLTLLHFVLPAGSSVSSATVLLMGVFSSAAFWYEAYRFWRLKPY